MGGDGWQSEAKTDGLLGQPRATRNAKSRDTDTLYIYYQVAQRLDRNPRQDH